MPLLVTCTSVRLPLPLLSVRYSCSYIVPRAESFPNIFIRNSNSRRPSLFVILKQVDQIHFLRTMASNLTNGSAMDVVADFKGCRGCSPTSVLTLLDGKFMVNGQVFLTEVPSNIVASPLPAKKAARSSIGCFVGFDSDTPKSWHAVPIGQLRGIRFMSIFRFKVWWTTHWVGDNGRDVEHETQMLMLDKSAAGRPYVLLLPLIEGPFRSCLRPGAAGDDNVELCVESGSTSVAKSSFRSVLYMQAGDDPYKLVKEAMRVARDHLGTFKLLEEKSTPGIVDKFGWCTWDAFYLKVHPEGIWEGVQGLVEGGCPPGLVLIDDGWQSICHDEDDLTTGEDGVNRTAAGEQMPCRLIRFQENYKFRDYRSGRSGAQGMGAFVGDLKEKFGSVEYVYVWHALCGYWGGLRPGVEALPEARVIKPRLTPGLEKTMEDLAVDRIVNNGVGLVLPERAYQLYEGLHSHLASVGIDGVKVDVIQLLEMLCDEFGGRVELAKTYYKALSASVKEHFKGNGVIASMEHCNDFMFLGTETISLGRVGDDFWCTDSSGDPNGAFWLQGCHMVHCAYNSLWIGNFIHPDWDMFQSTHPSASFHAASRAISGGPIYVSDSVGQHDFDLLKSLVLPDGSVLRCDSYALPTRDCLFQDPLHDGRTLLKIWNLNKFTGVLGAFNCQGGGWSREARMNKCASEFSKRSACEAAPDDIEWCNGTNPIPVEGVELFAVYSYQGKKLAILKPGDKVEIVLDPFDFELLTVSPVTMMDGKKIQFAPIGLTNMLNTGGAIQSYGLDQKQSLVRVGVKGRGEMKAFSSQSPKACLIDGKEVEFDYDADEKVVDLRVPWTSQYSGLSMINYLF